MKNIKELKVYTALSIAGFDGSGGAGMQADLKTFSALGCYGMSVLTALPIQNTVGVRSVYDITLQCIADQFIAIAEDIQIGVLKIGMLHREEIIIRIAELIQQYGPFPLVLDPVMIAKSGDKLLQPNAIAALKNYLFPLTTILTPNLLEASELLKRPINTTDQMELAAKELGGMGPQAVVVKGGHLEGACADCLFIKNATPEIHWFTHPRITTKNTHGTGCTFAAAIAAFLCKETNLFDAVRKAKNYITKAIETGSALLIGQGNGPVHHFYGLWKD